MDEKEDQKAKENRIVTIIIVLVNDRLFRLALSVLVIFSVLLCGFFVGVDICDFLRTDTVCPESTPSILPTANITSDPISTSTPLPTLSGNNNSQAGLGTPVRESQLKDCSFYSDMGELLVTRVYGLPYGWKISFDPNLFVYSNFGTSVPGIYTDLKHNKGQWFELNNVDWIAIENPFWVCIDTDDRVYVRVAG